MNMLTKEKSTRLRNALALSLGDLQANETVPLLIKFIKDPENESKRGSFVYALQKLDCKEFFLDIVDLICTGDYEVYDHAHTIFESLVDDVTYNEKLLAKKKLKNQEQIELAMPPSKHPQFDRIHFVREALKLLD
jgi:HEAT repeat protein